MVEEFNDAWGKRSRDFVVKNNSYKGIVLDLIDQVINPGRDEYSRISRDVDIIDHGNYQGTLIILIHIDHYQPCSSDYYVGSVSYGSCSCCDALQGALSIGNRKSRQAALKGIALNILQSFKQLLK